jgi:hypothetical protein
LSDAKESALERLSEAAGREFPHLLAARAETGKGGHETDGNERLLHQCP